MCSSDLYLLADVLKALGQGLATHDFLDEAHLERLREGADALVQALKDPAKAGGRKK